MGAALSLRHFLLALAIVFVWGTNFVVIKHGLEYLPPLAFAALRFTLAALPAMVFIRRPAASWGNIAAYGLLIGAGQFGLLFFAMKGSITPGLASLVVQMQVFFTIGLSMMLTQERVKTYQWSALLLAVCGLIVIGMHVDADTTMLGLVLVLLAAASWSAGNIVGRRAGKVDMLAYMVWSAPFGAAALWIMALAFEGWPAVADGIGHADAGAWAALIWQSLGNTLFGYAGWAWLLARYPASTITPMALLVPVFGMSASTLLLGESMPAWKILAIGLVLTGLAVNLFWPNIVNGLKRVRA